MHSCNRLVYQQEKQTQTFNQTLTKHSIPQILRLIKHMKDKSKIIFILYFVTNHSPDGADAVAAAYECYKFTLEHERELPTHDNAKVSEIVDKIKRKYPILKTQHLLHFYNLADDKLFQLVEHPMELINALYHHESIMKQHKPDINKVYKRLYLNWGFVIFCFTFILLFFFFFFIPLFGWWNVFNL
jgi:kinetochore-associated protein 1